MGWVVEPATNPSNIMAAMAAIVMAATDKRRGIGSNRWWTGEKLTECQSIYMSNGKDIPGSHVALNVQPSKMALASLRQGRTTSAHHHNG